MLAFIRDKAKGVIAWVIVILIIIPFALWGVNEYFYGGGEVVVARIGDRKVLLPEYQDMYQRELAMRRQVLGSSFDPGDPAIRRDVIDRLVNTEVTTQAAVTEGFRISDVRLGQQIHSMREFQGGGQFDPELYDRLLRNSGMSKAQFEESLRRDLLMQQLIGGVSETGLLSGHDLGNWLRLSEQQRKLAFLIVPATDYLNRIQLDDGQIERYYQDNLERFVVQEQAAAEYLELSNAGLTRNIPVNESDIRRMYEEKAAMFSVGEERRARHILIEVKQEADPDTVEKARAQAQDLLGRIERGESFEDLARKYSNDSGSAGSGGDLGFFGRGMMVGPFEDAVFAMHKGEVKGPVRSPFGFHIIKLDQVKPGSARSFEEVRAMLEGEYRKSKAEEQFFELTERLADMTFEHSDTLAVAAQELGLTVHETGLFTRDQGEGIASEIAFRQAAFSTDVLEGGHNSALIELGPERVIVLRIRDRRPTSHLPLEAVKGLVVQELREQGAAEMARKEGESILERVAQGKSLEELARSHHAGWNPPVLARRDDASIPPAVLGAAFSMSRPQGDTPVMKGIPLPAGDYAVIALYRVVDGKPETVGEERRKRQADDMTAQIRQRAVEDFVRSLKERMKAHIYEDKL